MQNKNQVFILFGVVAVALLAVGVTTYSLSGQNEVNTRPAAQAAVAGLEDDSFSSKKEPNKVPPGLEKKCLQDDSCLFVAPNDPINLALFLNNGANKILGEDDVRGLHLAQQARPQVFGHNVEFVGKAGDAITIPSKDGGLTVPNYNDGVTNATRVAYANEIAGNPTILGVIGTSLSGATSATFNGSPTVAKILGNAGVFMLSGQVQGTTLIKDRKEATGTGLIGEYLARTIPSGSKQAIGMAEQFCKPGMKFVTVSDVGNKAYTQTLTQAFANRCTSLSGNHVGGATVEIDETTLSKATVETALASITANGAPDMIYMAYTSAPLQGKIVRWAKHYMAANNLMNPNYGLANSGFINDTWKAANDGTIAPTDSYGLTQDAEGVYVSTYKHPASPQLAAYWDAYGENFPNQYQADKILRGPTEFSPYNYDAYNVFLDAIEKVTIKTDDLGGWVIIPRKALKDAILYQTNNVIGLTGTLNCKGTTTTAAPVFPNYEGDCNPDIETLVTQTVCTDSQTCEFIENKCPAGDTCVAIGTGEKVKIANLHQMIPSNRSNAGFEAARGIYIANQDRPQVLGRNIEFVGNTTTSLESISSTSPINFKHFQDPATAAGAKSAAQALITYEPETIAVLGGTNSASASGSLTYIKECNEDGCKAVKNSTRIKGLNEVLSNAKLLQVSPAAVAASLTDKCPPLIVDPSATPGLISNDTTCREEYFARTAPNSAQQGIQMAEYAYNQGYRTAATIHDSRVAGMETIYAFEEKFIELVGSRSAITARTFVATGDSSATTVGAATGDCITSGVDKCLAALNTIISAGAPDIVYVGFTNPVPAGTFIKKAKTLSALTTHVTPAPTSHVGTVFGGFHTLGVDLIYKSGGSATQETLFTNADVQSFAPTYSAYDVTHDNLFGPQKALFQDATGYDAYNLVLDAIAAAATQTDDLKWLVIPRSALKEELLKNNETAGLVGTHNCKKQSVGSNSYNVGDCSVNMPFAVYEVQTCTPDSATGAGCTFGKK